MFRLSHSLQLIPSTYFDLKFVLTSIMDVLILNTKLIGLTG